MLVRAGRGGYGVFSLDSVKLITSPNVVTNVHKLSKFLLVLIFTLSFMGTTSWILRFTVTQGAAELRNKIVCISTHFSLTLNTE